MPSAAQATQVRSGLPERPLLSASAAAAVAAAERSRVSWCALNRSMP